MVSLKRAPPRGLIGRPAPEVRGHHARYVPDAPLDATLEHFWSVSWQLEPGVQAVRETLPHPCFHVVVERGEAMVAGVARARFTHHPTTRPCCVS